MINHCRKICFVFDAEKEEIIVNLNIIQFLFLTIILSINGFTRTMFSLFTYSVYICLSVLALNDLSRQPVSCKESFPVF